MDLWSLLESIANFFLKGDTEAAQYQQYYLYIVYFYMKFLDLFQSLDFERGHTRVGHYSHFEKSSNIVQTESIWFIEDQAFSSSYDLASSPLPPLPLVRSNRRNNTGRLRKRDNLLKGGGGRGDERGANSYYGEKA